MLDGGLSLLAQAGNEPNPHSIRTILPQDIMFKKSLWFRMDLRTKNNVGFFAEGQEFTKLLVDAVKEGQIVPYADDDMQARLSLTEFNKRLAIPQATREETDLMGEFDTGDWGDAAEEADLDKLKALDGQEQYFPNQLYVVELKMDRIFDRRKSQMVNDLVAVTIILPAEVNPIGVDKVVGTFSYRELYEKVFKQKDEETGALVDRPEAIWYNSQNPAFSHNLADAFALNLWSGTLTKYENPKNNMIVDMYGNGKKGLIMSQEAVYKLLDYEATLWSY